MPNWDGKSDRRKPMSSEGSETLRVFIQGEFKNFDTKLEDIINRLDEHHNDLYGKDSDTPGIKLKVDRLEQSKKNSDKHLGVVYGTAIALFFKTAWDWVMGHK